MSCTEQECGRISLDALFPEQVFFVGLLTVLSAWFVKALAIWSMCWETRVGTVVFLGVQISLLPRPSPTLLS